LSVVQQLFRFIACCLSACFLLTGCDRLTPEQKVCNQYPHLCIDMHKDSFCKDERSDVILARFNTEEQIPSLDKAMYDELLVSEKYEACIKIKSQIRHVQHKYRATDRTEGYLNILKKLEVLKKATKGSKNPYLAYYHWSRFRDKRALKNFINAERMKEINTPELKGWLADYYSRSNPEKALTLYKEAIAETDIDDINNRWLVSIATISKRLGLNDAYYVYHKIAAELDAHDVDERILMEAIGNDSSRAKQLQREADQLMKLIRVGKFKKSKYYIFQNTEDEFKMEDN
jgi:hypothetical protein